MVRVVFLFLLFTGCEWWGTPPGPRDAVEQYLDHVFHMEGPEGRSKLIGLATGKLRQAVEGASAETFADAYLKSRYELESFAIVRVVERTLRDAEVTYQLTYTDHQTGSPTQVAIENTAKLRFEGGKWKIAEVSDSHVDFIFSAQAPIRAKPLTEKK